MALGSFSPAPEHVHLELVRTRLFLQNPNVEGLVLLIILPVVCVLVNRLHRGSVLEATSAASTTSAPSVGPLLTTLLALSSISVVITALASVVALLLLLVLYIIIINNEAK